MFVAPFARAMLSAWLRSRAMIPRLMRIRLASSARVTSLHKINFLYLTAFYQINASATRLKNNT
jgi:hypothetical protein